MRLFTFLLCWSSILLCAAQDDTYHSDLRTQLQGDYSLTGGTWVLTGNEQTNFDNATTYGGTAETFAPLGQLFEQAMRLDIPAMGANPWDAGYINSSNNAIQIGDKVLFTTWLRVQPGAVPGGKIAIFAENATTYHKEVYLITDLDTVWQQFLLPFESSQTYAAGTLNLGYHLAYADQVVEVAGLNALNFAQSVDLDDLPTLFTTTYSGSDPNASWRPLADARIEQHRKADMNLTIVDPQGAPISNTDVRVVMTRHAFGFGSAINPRRLEGAAWNNPTYQSKITNLDGQGHGFNVGVTENALKWDAWEEQWAGTPLETSTGIQWLADNGVEMRGHVLVWPGWDFMPNDMQANQNDPAYLKNRIDDRLETMLNYSGTAPYVRDWDVINEIAHVRDLENALAGQPGYPTGRELYAHIMQQVKAEDSSIVSYLNDYEILSNGSVNGAAYTLFKLMIQQIINGGGPVDGIGFQAHMGTNLVSPDSLYAIIEDCYQTFNRPIKITEYDLDKILDDEIEGQYLGDFLKLVFSHPAVEAFLMWGFWDGAHWLDNAPLYYTDWSPKPALATFNELVFGEWWTDTVLTTDANGQVDLRGFKGEYRVYVSLNDVGYEEPFSLGNDLDTTIQILSLSNVGERFNTPLKVFPNPFSDNLRIEFPQAADWQIQLLDLKGRQIQSSRIQGDRAELTLPPLAAGVYLLQAQDQNGNRLYQRLMHR